MEEIFHRTSVRKFTDKPVEAEKIEKLLKAAMYAPTAGNQRAWEFYVVLNKDALNKLGDKSVSPYSSPVKNAAMAIVIAYHEETRMPEYNDIDAAIASENIWLEADHLGLGAVMLGIAPIKERVEKVNEILNIPEGQQAFTIIAIGYPEKEGKQIDRFDESKIHYIR
ncbi:MAG: nitroreductase family protein [Coriobacteriales bacterium]|jgi:nitroreductase